MGYTMALDMSISDFAVRVAIEILSKRQDKISHADIAKLIGCHEATIDRAIPRLIKAGIVTRTGNNRQGYNLKVNNAYLNN